MHLVLLIVDSDTDTLQLLTHISVYIIHYSDLCTLPIHVHYPVHWAGYTSGSGSLVYTIHIEMQGSSCGA